MTDATRAEALRQARRLQRQDRLPGRVAGCSRPRRRARLLRGNRMRANRFEFERQLDRLERAGRPGEWEIPAHVVNAYYHPLLNEIVFPAGILRPPFFYADADDAVNYGAIGAVIGHEITHGFDDQGSHFDARAASCGTGGPRRTAPSSTRRAPGARRPVRRVRGARRPAGERPPDAGREHRRPRRPEDRVRRAARGARRQAGRDHRGPDPRAAVLPLVGDRVAHELHGRVPAPDRQDGPALSRAGACEQPGLQPAARSRPRSGSTDRHPWPATRGRARSSGSYGGADARPPGSDAAAQSGRAAAAASKSFFAMWQ